MSASAGRILVAEAEHPSVEWHHAAAVADLLTQNTAVAVSKFEQITRAAPYEAAVWNDLAAARYEFAGEQNEAADLPAALAAVDQALRLAPRFPEAMFNRALILSRLGLVSAAKRAWHAVLAAEQKDDWGREASLRLHALNAADPQEFSPRLKQALAAAEGGNVEPLRDLARVRAQDVRTAGEALALNSWPEALISRDAAGSERALHQALLIATALRDVNGDALLSDVLRFIDHERANPARWHSLVIAHRVYRAARIMYGRQLPDSDTELARSAALLDDLGSPMAHVARYYCANAMFDRNRVEEARRLLVRVLREIDGLRYPSLAAGAEKQLGLCYAFRGMWTASLLHLDRARQLYTQSGEQTNAAFASAIIGEVHDRTGQFTAGWRDRQASLAILSRFAPAERLAAVLGGGVHAEIMRREFESALSLLQIAGDHVQTTGNPALIAETLLRKAQVLLVIRSSSEAERVLREAENAVDQIADPLTRSRIQADVWMVESEILRRTDPSVAREIVTRAVAFYEAKNFHMLLPAAYLARARTSLAANDEEQALDDLLKGLREIEQQRTSVAPDTRVTVFDTVPDLLAETVHLLLARGRNAEAYAVVERARARTLTEALGLLPATAEGHVDVDSIVRSLPPHTAILEYTLLPDAVDVFCIRRQGLSIVHLSVRPERLRDQVSRLQRAMDLRVSAATVDQLAGEIHREVIAPMTDLLRDIDALVIVPDRFLNAVPFPALFDRDQGRYLIEDYRITVAPSGEFSLHRPHARHLEQVLIVNDPQLRNGDPSLPGSRREAAGIARLYRNATTLTGPDATAERFLAAVPHSAVVHYAGHARSTDSGGFLSLAELPRHDGRIDAAAICRLHLPSTRLVVLAACGTMRGNGDRVEGMPSIARAFLAAGVPTVVGTLWEVDDEGTASLFLRFHEFLRRGLSPSAALQASQRELLRGRDERLRHPAVWAAAEVLGSD